MKGSIMSHFSIQSQADQKRSDEKDTKSSLSSPNLTMARLNSKFEAMRVSGIQ